MKKIITTSIFFFVLAFGAFIAHAETPCVCTPTNPQGNCSTSSPVQGKIESDVPSCIIAAGEGSCGIKLSWSSWNTEPLPSFAWVSGPGIKADGNVSDKNVEIVHGTSKFDLIYRSQAAGSNDYHLKNLSSVSVSASCASGSTWNRTICVADTVVVPPTTINCGSGTHISNGVCVADTVIPNCGSGTYLSGNVCVSYQNQNQINCGPGTYSNGNTCLPVNNYQNNYIPQPQYIQQPIFQNPQPVITVSQPEPTVVTRTIYRNTTQTTKKTDNFVNGIGTNSPIMLSIEDKYENVSKGDVVDFTIKYKNIGNVKLTRPLLQVIVPSNITLTNSSSGGTYQNADHTLSIVLPDLNPNDEGVVYAQGVVSNQVLGSAKLVSKALLIYTTPNNTQETAMAYTTNGAKVANNGSTLGASALFGNGGNMGLVGWLIIIILILIIILIVRSMTKRNVYVQNSNGGHH